MEDHLLADPHPHVLEEGAALCEGLTAGATRVRPRTHVYADVFLQSVATFKPEGAVRAREWTLLRAQLHARPGLTPIHSVVTTTATTTPTSTDTTVYYPPPTTTNATTCTTTTLRHGAH